jgi:hypothetical protein
LEFGSSAQRLSYSFFGSLAGGDCTVLHPAGGFGGVKSLGCQDGKHNLERKYDKLKVGMTDKEVSGIMGSGKSVTAEEIAAYAEYPKLDLAGLSGDTRWVKWGDGYPYVLAGFDKDKLVVARIVGVAPAKKIGP